MFSRLFKRKRTRARNLILILLPFVLLLGFFGFVAFRSLKSQISSSPVVQESHTIESMTYVLRDNATEYQVELFNELSDAVSDGADNQKIAELVVENYIADFYTWTNKVGSYDVGGMYYVYSPYKGAISLNARRTFYKYLTYYINEFGNEELPEIISTTIVESKTNTDKYHLPYENTDVESYSITCTWEFNDYTYTDNNRELRVWNSEGVQGYIKKGYFTVVKNPANNRFEIVEVWGDD